MSKRIIIPQRKRGVLVGLDPTKKSGIFTEWVNFARERIVGQDRYIEEVGRALERATSGLRDPEKPIACLLVPGPSRVGKTLLVKVLAEFLFGDRKGFLRLDGQFFSQEHAVASLIGSPHGYVGYDDSPILTQEKLDGPALRARQNEFRDSVSSEVNDYLDSLEIRLKRIEDAYRQVVSGRSSGMFDKQAALNNILADRNKIYEELRRIGYPIYDPARETYLSILLIDEVERAHRKFHNILFTVLDEGQIVSTREVVTSFVNCIIFLTSNVGSVALTQYLRERRGISVRLGFQGQSLGKSEKSEDQEIYGIIEPELRKAFLTEFLNRMSKIVIARPLSEEELYGVLAIQIKELHDRFMNQGCPLLIKLSRRVKDLIVSESLDRPEENASILVRKMKSFVEDKLVLFHVTDQIGAGDIVIVVRAWKKKELRFFKIVRSGRSQEIIELTTPLKS